MRYLPLGDAAALLEVRRTVEDSARRLGRLLIASDELAAYSDRLFDTAVHEECARVKIGDTERCLPTSSIAALDMFAPGCVQRVRVTQVAMRACRTPAFAVSVSDPIEIAAIGEPTTQVVYRTAGDGSCKPYTPPADQQLRALGPPLPDDTFLAARPYGER